MAEPITYQVPREDPATRQREQAYAELDRLVLLLHEHQVLRLACDSTAGLADLGRLLTSELDTEEGKQGLENLYVLMRVLGRIPPHKFERVAEAAEQGLEQLEQTTTASRKYPPGVKGAVKLLRDRQLWQALGPALEGLKTFAARLKRR